MVYIAHVPLGNGDGELDGRVPGDMQTFWPVWKSNGEPYRR